MPASRSTRATDCRVASRRPASRAENEFVEQHEPWLATQRTCHRDPLLLPTG